MHHTRSSEHIEHSLGDNEATKDVDGGDECSGRCHSLDRVGRVEASAHLQETTDGSNTRNGIRNRHEWRVESWSYAPNGVVSDDGCQTQSRGHGGERSVRGSDSESHHRAQSTSVHQGVFQLEVEIVGRRRLHFFNCFGLCK